MKFPHISSVISFFEEVHTYFDTNAVMNEGFENLLKLCSRQLKENHITIYITSSVLCELKKISESEEKSTAITAKTRLAEIEVLTNQGIIKHIGNPNQKCPATQQLVKIAIKYRSHNKLAFITCNKELSHDLLMQNNLKSYNGHHIYVFNISKKGFLYDYEERSEKAEKKPLFGKINQENDLLNLFGLN